jgi:predicted DNA-binding mobile mystery protein A
VTAPSLARFHLDRRVGNRAGEDLRAHLERPRAGWIRATREALAMNGRQLAERLGVTQSAVTQLEQSEAKDSITLERLRAAAAALDCVLVYGFVPMSSLEAVVRARAGEVAEARLGQAEQLMRLEDQVVDASATRRQRDELVESLIDDARLWDRPAPDDREG